MTVSNRRRGVSGRGIPLSFRRTYNAARAAVEGSLGFGWTNSYDTALSVSVARATIRQGERQRGRLRGVGDRVGAGRSPGADVAGPGRRGSWTFTRRNREIIVFDATGALVSLADRNGETTTLSRPGPDPRW